MMSVAIAVVSVCLLAAPARANTLDAPEFVTADKTGAFSYEAVFTPKVPVVIASYAVIAYPDDNVDANSFIADCFCPPPDTFGCPREPGEKLVVPVDGSLLNPSENGIVTVTLSLCGGGHFQVSTTVEPWVPWVSIQTVTVGNPGNAADTEVMGLDGTTGYGSVAYTYDIGTVEVTAGQYTEFLNAVAATDTHGVYNMNMANISTPEGCNIQRSGSSGSYTYSVASDWANRPVNYVSWGDAARLANWLHNGQPTGTQDLTTTEDGSYYLNGATSDSELMAVVRTGDATWVIPSEDEWYKAAYHYNTGTAGKYYDYPMGTDSVPNNGNPEGDTGNSANFYDGAYTIGSPYWRTEVGFFELSDSPYGTLDQGGNVWEWNEGILFGGTRGLRGGSFSFLSGFSLSAAAREYDLPTTKDFSYVGFRVANVAGARHADFDRDGDVDLFDFGMFQRELTGPN